MRLSDLRAEFLPTFARNEVFSNVIDASTVDTLKSSGDSHADIDRKRLGMSS
jgi:hypothetical protein